MILTPAPIQPSNLLAYQTYVSETCDQLAEFDKQHNKLQAKFAQYIYDRVEYGKEHFGYTQQQIILELEHEMPSHGRYIKAKSLWTLYRSMKFLVDVKSENVVLFNRVLAALNAGNIRYNTIVDIAIVGVELSNKMELLDEVCKKRIGRKDINLLLQSKKEYNFTNIIDGPYIMNYIKERFFHEDSKVYMPYPSGEEMHGIFQVPDARVRPLLIHGHLLDSEGKTLEPESYDGAVLYMPQFNVLHISDDTGIKNVDDFIERLDFLVQSCYTAIKLDGILCVVSWNKPLFNQQRIDYSSLLYKYLEQGGEWIDTVVNTLLKFKKRYPNNLFRTIYFFQKR
jgi:SAM-dependent methyltransferase